MLKKNYWIRSGAYTMLQRVAAFLFGFGSYFFLVRYFSVDDFGEWTLYVLISTIVEMSRSAFIQNAFVKFFNEGEADRDVLFTGSVILNLLSTLLFIILLVALSPWLQSFWDSQAIGVLILWYCATSLVLVPLTQLNYLEQANHQFAGVFWSAVVRQGSFFILVVVCYFFYPGMSLSFFSACQFLSACLGVIPAFVATRNMLPRRYVIEWAAIGKLFKFGKYILGTGVTSTIGKSAGQVLLGGVSHSMVALYDSSARILNFIEIPTLSISNIVYPKIAELAGREGHQSVGQLYKKSVGSIVGIILPIVVFVLLFPEFVLSVTAGKKYLEASGALRVMATASLLIPFNVQLGTVFEVINKPHVSFYINLVSNILNIILNIILIKMFGLMGAAYSFAITVGFIYIIGQWFMYSYVGVNGSGTVMAVGTFYKQGLIRINKLINEKLTKT